MKFYTFEKNSISYKRFRFFRGKFLIPFFLIQVVISSIFVFIISTYYDTPDEKKLRKDLVYLVEEFNNINKRIIEAETTLGMIKEHDSIIYRSIFDINQEPRKQMGLEFDDISPNFYMSVVQETNNRISILNDKMAKELYQLDGLVDLAHSHQEMLLHIPAIQPIENKNLKRIASGWGMRTHPIYGIPKFHYGLDFTAPLGTPVYATGDGVVQIIIKDSDKRSQGYGNLIIIDHGYGYKTLYSHLQKFKSKPGEKVTRGEIIAYVGSTGLSTGPHLHYEVIKDNKKVDPIYYLFGSLTPEEYQKVIELSNRIQKAYD